jgi:2-phospho-L-lactate/phosphoenolpyruvate guanylyltransferase
MAQTPSQAQRHARPEAQPGAPLALIPLRTGGKSRLGGALAAAARDRLVLAMLDDVLAAVRAAGITDVRILAGGPDAAAAAAERGLSAIADPATHDGPNDDPRELGPAGGRPAGDARLRAAVDAALAAVPSDRVRLVLAADLPRLSAAEVAATLSDPAEVVIAPTAGGGTALLRLAPHVTLPARYGPGSAGAHVTAAEAAGLTVAVLDLPGARYDVDAAADLAELTGPLDGAAPGSATAAFVAGARG